MAFCEAEAYRIEAIGMFIKVGIQEDANPMLYDTAEMLWCLASVGRKAIGTKVLWLSVGTGSPTFSDENRFFIKSLNFR